MKRLVVALLTLALLGSVLSPPAVSAPPGKTSCSKILRTKWVWVKVKRKGKTVKVKRKRTSWVCDPFEAPGPPRLGVVAKEFRFVLTRPYVKSGDVILQLDNQGDDTHNLRIGPGKGGPAFVKVGNTAPRKQTTVEVPLTAGKYRLWCSLPRHAKLGMKAVLTVK